MLRKLAMEKTLELYDEPDFCSEELQGTPRGKECESVGILYKSE